LLLNIFKNYSSFFLLCFPLFVARDRESERETASK
jgi:hypothetical protein